MASSWTFRSMTASGEGWSTEIMRAQGLARSATLGLGWPAKHSVISLSRLAYLARRSSTVCGWKLRQARRHPRGAWPLSAVRLRLPQTHQARQSGRGETRADHLVSMTMKHMPGQSREIANDRLRRQGAREQSANIERCWHSVTTWLLGQRARSVHAKPGIVVDTTMLNRSLGSGNEDRRVGTRQAAGRDQT